MLFSHDLEMLTELICIHYTYFDEEITFHLSHNVIIYTTNNKFESQNGVSLAVIKKNAPVHHRDTMPLPYGLLQR